MKDTEDVAENTTVVSASRGIVESFQPQIEKAIYRGKFSYFIDSVLLLVNISSFTFLIMYCYKVFQLGELQYVSWKILFCLFTGIFLERIYAIIVGLVRVQFSSWIYKLLFIVLTVPGNTQMLFLSLYPYDRKKNMIRVRVMVATIVGSILQAFALFYTLFDAQTYCKRFPQSDYCGNTPDASSNRQQLIIRGVVAIVGGFITWQFIVIELIKDFCCIVPYEDWKRNKETQEI